MSGAARVLAEAFYATGYALGAVNTDTVRPLCPLPPGGFAS